MNVFYIGAEQPVQVVADGKTVELKQGQSLSVSDSTGAGLLKSMNWTTVAPTDPDEAREEKEAARAKAEAEEIAKAEKERAAQFKAEHEKRFPSKDKPAPSNPENES